jgi:hypothetical protein
MGLGKAPLAVRGNCCRWPLARIPARTPLCVGAPGESRDPALHPAKKGDGAKYGEADRQSGREGSYPSRLESILFKAFCPVMVVLQPMDVDVCLPLAAGVPPTHEAGKTRCHTPATPKLPFSSATACHPVTSQHPDTGTGHKDTGTQPEAPSLPVVVASPSPVSNHH